jgi:hypothetical protein
MVAKKSGPRRIPQLKMTAEQLANVRKINETNKQIWQLDAEQLASLSKRYGSDEAHRLMAEARIIADEYALNLGVQGLDAAVSSVEKIRAERRQQRIDGRILTNVKRHGDAVRRALHSFRVWEEKLAVTLAGKGPDERIKLYFKTKRPSRRTKEHVRGLRRSGKI